MGQWRIAVGRVLGSVDRDFGSWGCGRGPKRGNVLGGDQIPTAWRKELGGWVARISLRTITNVISVIPMFFSLMSAWTAKSHLLCGRGLLFGHRQILLRTCSHRLFG